MARRQRPSEFSDRLYGWCGCCSWLVGAVLAECLTISSISLANSSRPVAGMMIVSRRPATSSVIRRKRPRGFSFNDRTNVLRSICSFSVRSVSSLTGGREPAPPAKPLGEERSCEVISHLSLVEQNNPNAYLAITRQTLPFRRESQPRNLLLVAPRKRRSSLG